MSDTRIRWSHRSLEELQTFWNTTIEPTLHREGYDLAERPGYDDLLEVGYGGIQDALRRHHDMTLSEFLETVGYDDRRSAEEYRWGIQNETTIDELEGYLETVRRRRGLSEHTVRSKRTRLARFARRYRDLFDDADLVARTRDRDLAPEENTRAMAIFDEFDDELRSPESKLHHLTDVEDFYTYLGTIRNVARFNPVANFRESVYEKWTRETPDRADRSLSSLQAAHVRELVAACDSLEDRLLVLATCAWGLRRGEVASLHHDQFVLSDGDPRIVFGADRKNGPGSVTIQYGLEDLEHRLSTLAVEAEWNGFLFPSRAAQSGHISPDTVTNRFKRLARDAGVRVDGEVPTPQLGRRFWYRTYLDAVQALARQVERIAQEQGSTDARVVVENYLGEAEARKRRRKLMSERLAAAFGT
ncbi:tyrosine-type recombinase/integrase [Natrarchaeobius chitinivorans]|uniref:Site-specific integrase n=1 Tax=Natrarchaeobius chitinivorans TaxID=1679083 RepID=A0A3N6LLJ1_NATCH|nr:tyrosine-type recombinase/integrase [Natrarchaeobius chitinivorans]RQG89718.1 site-specific integrase [Natrarchaeobius chitinivorans]